MTVLVILFVIPCLRLKKAKIMSTHESPLQASWLQI